MWAARGLAAFLIALALPAVAGAAALPAGFAYLADVAPEIRQDMRYAGGRNFTGRPVPGYRAAECVLAKDAALALKAVQQALAPRALALKVFDCYRPAKAVRRFVAWAGGGSGFDPVYHPRVSRNALIGEGYIARMSGHSNGYSVDLTLTDNEGRELDLGTPFDFFDPLACTESRDVPASAAKLRRTLVSAMARGGFVNYSREWWHFTLKTRPRALHSYDFDIVPRGH